MKKTKNETTSKNVYDVITDMFIEKMESGVIPWIKPWQAFEPINLKTAKTYRGLNYHILSMLAGETAVFATFKQVSELGASVKKGAKALPVVYHLFKDDEETEKSKYLGAKYYNVFKIEDTTLTKDQIIALTGLELTEQLKDSERNCEIDDAVKQFCSQTSLRLVNIENAAYYQPSSHVVNMPKYEHFKSVDGYYATLLHELVHSTAKELGRDLKGHFGSIDYSFEELVAELGASFLCHHFQVNNERNIENTASYLKGWSRKFKDDKKMLFKASSQAQKAVDYILDKMGRLSVPF